MTAPAEAPKLLMEAATAGENGHGPPVDTETLTKTGNVAADVIIEDMSSVIGRALMSCEHWAPIAHRISEELFAKNHNYLPSVTRKIILVRDVPERFPDNRRVERSGAAQISGLARAPLPPHLRCRAKIRGGHGVSSVDGGLDRPPSAQNGRSSIDLVVLSHLDSFIRNAVPLRDRRATQRERSIGRLGFDVGGGGGASQSRWAEVESDIRQAEEDARQLERMKPMRFFSDEPVRAEGLNVPEFRDHMVAYGMQLLLGGQIARATPPELRPRDGTTVVADPVVDPSRYRLHLHFDVNHAPAGREYLVELDAAAHARRRLKILEALGDAQAAAVAAPSSSSPGKSREGAGAERSVADIQDLYSQLSSMDSGVRLEESGCAVSEAPLRAVRHLAACVPELARGRHRRRGRPVVAVVRSDNPSTVPVLLANMDSLVDRVTGRIVYDRLLVVQYGHGDSTAVDVVRLYRSTAINVMDTLGCSVRHPVITSMYVTLCLDGDGGCGYLDFPGGRGGEQLAGIAELVGRAPRENGRNHREDTGLGFEPEGNRAKILRDLLAEIGAAANPPLLVNRVPVASGVASREHVVSVVANEVVWCEFFARCTSSESSGGAYEVGKPRACSAEMDAARRDAVYSCCRRALWLLNYWCNAWRSAYTAAVSAPMHPYAAAPPSGSPSGPLLSVWGWEPSPVPWQPRFSWSVRF